MTYTYMYIHTRTHTYTYIHTRMHNSIPRNLITHSHIHRHTYTDIHTHIHTYIHTFTTHSLTQACPDSKLSLNKPWLQFNNLKPTMLSNLIYY